MGEASDTRSLAFELRENSPQLIDKRVVVGCMVGNKRANLKIKMA